MKNRLAYAAVVVAVAAALASMYLIKLRHDIPVVTTEPAPAPAPAPLTTEKGASDILRNVSVHAGDLVASPVTVTGEARGTWYFEASFPARILDGDGKVLFAGPAQAQSAWTTADYVPFKVTLAFPATTTATGTLVLAKDNPSGMPEKDDELRIPIRFK